MKQVTKNQFVTGTLWKLLENFGSRGVSLLVSIILARLLLPEDYGIVGLTAVFIALSDILIQGGFSTALIQKKEVSDTDYSTVFYINLIISAVMYTVIFIFAPVISAFFAKPLLVPVLRVLSLVLFLQAFTAVRTAMLTRGMNFRMLFSSSLISNILSGITGIVLAFVGYGVWALVAQQITQILLLNIILLVRLKWRPLLIFSFDSVRSLLPFGVRVLGSSLISYLGDSIFSAAIAKVYSVRDLGYSDKGSQLPREMSLYTFGAVSSALLPTLASLQDDVYRVRQIVRKVIATCSFVIFPIMTLLVFTAEPLMVFLFSDIWLPGVPVMQWTCLYYAATPLMLINVQVFFAMGRGGIRMRTEAINLILMIIALLVTVLALKGNIYILAAARAFVAVILYFVTIWEVNRLIGYSFREIIADLCKPFLGSVLTAVVLWPISLIEIPNLTILMIQALAAIISYYMFSKLLRNPSLNEIMTIIKGLVNRNSAASRGHR